MYCAYNDSLIKAPLAHVIWGWWIHAKNPIFLFRLKEKKNRTIPVPAEKYEYECLVKDSK